MSKIISEAAELNLIVTLHEEHENVLVASFEYKGRLFKGICLPTDVRWGDPLLPPKHPPRSELGNDAHPGDPLPHDASCSVSVFPAEISEIVPPSSPRPYSHSSYSSFSLATRRIHHRKCKRSFEEGNSIYLCNYRQNKPRSVQGRKSLINPTSASPSLPPNMCGKEKILLQEDEVRPLSHLIKLINRRGRRWRRSLPVRVTVAQATQHLPQASSSSSSSPPHNPVAHNCASYNISEQPQDSQGLPTHSSQTDDPCLTSSAPEAGKSSSASPIDSMEEPSSSSDAGSNSLPSRLAVATTANKKRRVSHSQESSMEPVTLHHSDPWSSSSCEPSSSARGRRLRVNDLVWAKIPGHPFWPARVVSINPDSIACVAWLAGDKVSFVPCEKLLLFEENFNSKYDKKRRGTYAKAVQQAQEELDKLRQTHPSSVTAVLKEPAFPAS